MTTQPNQRLARVAGLVYLCCAAFGLFAMAVRGTVYVPGDAATTAHNLVAHAGLYRGAVAANLAASICWLFAAMALYLLFRHVNPNWARAMVVFAAAGTTMELLNMTYEVVALTVATDPSRAGALGAQGTDALVLLLFDLRRYGSLIAQLFAGLWLLPMGYLAYTSRLLPRVFGVGLGIACVGWIADLFAQTLAPGLGAALSPLFTTPAGLAEITTLLWLVARGVRTAQPAGQVPAAASLASR